MESSRRGVCFFGCVIVFGLLFVGGCIRTVAVSSRWANEKIVVDGRDSEWRSGGLYYDEKSNMKVGIRNDAQSLYLCLICKDENIQRQFLQQGFTLWVSQDKEKNKLWGLRYPVGGDGSGEMEGPEGSGGRGANPPGNPEETPSWDGAGGGAQGEPNGHPQEGRGQGGQEGEGPSGQRAGFLLSKNEFELLSSDDEQGEPIGSEELSALGIEGKVSQQQGGGLVYEVKIPLKKTEQTPYAAVASKKKGYLIGLISEKAENSKMVDGGRGEGGMGGGGRDGGMNGGMGGMNFSDMGGGGMGGGDMGRGGMGGGMGGTTVSSIELWAWIQLANPPGSGT